MLFFSWIKGKIESTTSAAYTEGCDTLLKCTVHVCIHGPLWGGANAHVSKPGQLGGLDLVSGILQRV